MELKINENFSGRIKFRGCECFFTINGFIVKIFPINSSEFNKIYDYVQAEDYDYKQWIYGVDECENNIAIYINQKPKLPFMNEYIYFSTPLIIKNTYNCENTDLSQFQEISFVGGTINIVHNPKIAIKSTKESIKFTDRDKYTAMYNLEIFGEGCQLLYSIKSNRDDGNFVNNSLGNVESYISLRFDRPQGIDKILDCFTVIKELIAFCVRQYNVEFKLLLDSQSSVCKVQRDVEDYVKLDFTRVIGIGLLGDMLPKLLRLLSEDISRPYLQFVPYRNRDIYFMSIANVRDICTSLEREYELHEITNKKIPEVSRLIKDLKKTVKGFKENNKDKLSERFYNLVNSTINYIDLPAKEQIMQLYRRYKEEITQLASRIIGLEIYTEEQFDERVQSFVKLRNEAAHSGQISFEKQAEIYYYLILIVYFSVLERVGFSVQESKNILSHMFK